MIDRAGFRVRPFFLGGSNTVTDVGGGWWRVVVNAVHSSSACYGILGTSDSGTPSINANGAPTFTGSTANAILVAR